MPVRKKLLVITRNFPPVQGGMERLNLHLVEELAKNHEVVVAAPAGAREAVDLQMKVVEVVLRPLWRCLAGLLGHGLASAVTWRPQVVLGGSGLMGPIVWITARLSGARAVVYVHGLDITVPHPAYRLLWLPFLRRMDCVIANSSVTRQLAIDAGVCAERITIVNPGVTEQPLEETGARARFRDRFGLGDAPVLLSVGRLAARKGLLEFVRDVLPIIVKQRPDTVFVIIGTEPKNALFAEPQSPASIQAAADEAGVGDRLKFLGSVTDDVLQDAFQGANLHVFPVQHIPGNPEGFGMVAIESAMRGLATVAYATGGVIDAVCDGENGMLVAPGDTQAFARAVNLLLDSPYDKSRVREFSRQFCWENFGFKISGHL